MGSNMVERLCEKKHKISAYDINELARERIHNITGATACSDYRSLINSLPNDEPRVIWLMVPSFTVVDLVNNLIPLLNKGDIIIDGGNTNFNHSIETANKLRKYEIEFVDVGVSGGPAGARSGACMMIGGNKEVFQEIEPLFMDLCVSDGYAHVGPIGSGHFVKMVHNGIEYGMMQSIAEGFNVMKQSDFNLDLTKVAKVYGHGSVISSALMDWLYDGYKKFGEDLETISGEVSHSGEGEWTVEYAKSINQPVEIIDKSLQFRKDSTGNPSYTGKVVSMLRNMFGGHEVNK